MSSRRGLPEFRKMRHDRHFVEELGNHSVLGVGLMVAVDRIEANRQQPRSDLGDLSELVASIRSHGVLEPLLVRPRQDGRGYELIAGERRFHAALEAGLEQVPCIELNLSDQEALEVALIENLHRKDLSPFEEAEGYRALVELHGYTHERVAEAVGKSRSTITEALKLLEIPPGLRELCRHADITAKSVLLLVARAGSVDEMESLLQEILERNPDRATLRAAALARPPAAAPAAAPPDGPEADEAATAEATGDATPAKPVDTPLQRFRPVQLRFRPEGGLGPVHVSLSIRQPGVTRATVITMLETLLEQLRRGELDDRLPPR